VAVVGDGQQHRVAQETFSALAIPACLTAAPSVAAHVWQR
jgi:hypothetical protein